MNKKARKNDIKSGEIHARRSFVTDRSNKSRRDKTVRVMAIIMIALMVGFSFITAGIFLLN
ncbi:MULTISPECIES: DUF4044 domain-containing protein [Mogibacterium]|jgi:hypothetical protein|uniref:DUF4044 domain-containing protein n=1 Tax=Mogibacterium timidum TaxID=35519 RepID=A0A7Y8VS12_9FIRM|nr:MULTISPECIES: DUF4044 domain-containing protein [Mogibacterium]EJU21234.1 hypothetical protein HMPREF1152_0820 [Mogibacterium sp. CM50]NWO23477.1 DUF4044 domain-containing protein [Mogibacterium timidum]